MNTEEINSFENMTGIDRLLEIKNMLESKLDEFPSRKSGFAIIAKNSEVSERTLRRIVAGTHNVSFQTIFKLYRYLYGLLNDRETFNQMPDLMKNFVMKEYANFSLANKDANWSPIVDEYLMNDSVFRGIYLETACGCLHEEKVLFEYGQQGLRTLKKMASLQIIKETSEGVYTASTERATLAPKVVKQLSETLVENYFSPDKLDLAGENFAQILFDGVDAETYNKLLALDYKVKDERIEIIKKGKKGNIKFWMISMIDTLSKELIYKENELSTKGGLQ